MRAGASDAGGMASSDSAAAPPIEEAAAPGPGIETIEPGSFRDRNGAVFYRDGEVLRGLSPRALSNWERLRGEPFFQDLVARGAVVASEQVDGPIAAGRGPWAAVLRHARIPFVSYPYEWPFGMLKDAALLHLEIMAAALEAGMTLKDSSAYNVQWRGARPVFIDIPSFEILPEGQPWIGYRQFCELFLYPLILQAYKGVDFRPWLRGSIDGIPAHALRRLMSARDLLRPGVLMHVVAQDTLQRRYSASPRNLRSSLAEAGFDKRLIARNVAKLARIVAGLAPGEGSETGWSGYDKTHSYGDADLAAKSAFVRQVAATRRWRLVWDLGCNTGTFSRIAAEHADYVVAMDGDWMAIERLYREQASRPDRDRILPLVVNLADPSPGQGWLGRERRSLPDRGRPDLTLCLALIHHIVIGANIPMRDFIGWLASLGTSLVIEFVSREDEMVQTLLRNKDDQYADYQPEVFETALAEYFEIADHRLLKGGKRSIYFARHPGPGRQRPPA
jgi:SAM-dependent methyltransferase